MGELRTKMNIIMRNAIPLLLVLLTAFFAWFMAAKSVSGTWGLLVFPTEYQPRLNFTVALLYIVWHIGQFGIYLLPFGGELILGKSLRGGHRLSYRLNGFFALVVNIVLFVTAHLCGIKMSLIADYRMEIFTTAVVVHLAFSLIILFAVSPKNTYDINPAANQGIILEDFLFGKSLNPRVGKLDIKYVLLRSAVIATIIYSFSILAKYYESSTSDRNYTLLFAIGMLLLYLSDALYYETMIVILREIAIDGCGCLFLMLLVFMPTGYCAAISYIASTNKELHLYVLFSITAIYLVGYWIFRSSNNEKAQFREDPFSAKFKDYEIIPTSSGQSLLASGWWGLSRHPNYFGDLMLMFAMCMTAGFSHILPYMYPLFLLYLLVDRERLDFADCKEKYGEDWERYCHRVKYRIIPFVY